MSRRRAGRYWLAFVAAGALALTACSGGSSNDPTSDQAATSSAAAGAGSQSSAATGSASGSAAAPAADVDTSAVLKFTSAGPTRNLDPAKQTSYGGWGYLVLVYDRLTMLDDKDQVVPGLATEWAFAKDGSSLELTLRKDVKFHDGTPFNAAAVKANIERGQTLEDSSLKASLQSIAKVEVVDDYTVKLDLAKGSGVSLPSVFATDAGMMVSPKAIESGAKLEDGKVDAGSGPYVVSEYVANEKVTLKRADSYWDPNVGTLAGMELTRVPDASTRLKGVQTGETDLSLVSSANEVAQAKQLADAGQIKQNLVTFRNVLGIYLRTNQGDLAKPEIRQAIAYAVDPKAVNALFSGTCAPTRQLVPANDWSAIPDYTYPYEFDEAKAKELVQKAGGGKVTVTFAAGTNAEQPANVVQAALTKVGIQATLNPVPNSENEPRFIAGDFELMVATSWSPKIDPAQTVDTYLLDTYKLASDPSLIKADAAKAADPTLSQEQRAPLYQNIWKTALEQNWYIPLCNQTSATIYNDKVLNAEAIPWANIGIWDLRNIAVKKG
ncbi:ABC transporter substrate-binding protein [Nakamurella lactea]|uniref:ABC transporter substrate-binding protein n=1 Tax=Nakamurella lactea TaxID=459515 RepID=UPI00048CA9B7|nr:ABC transporter substrate-binding protein [Nakamurella lactea]